MCPAITLTGAIAKTDVPTTLLELTKQRRRCVCGCGCACACVCGWVGGWVSVCVWYVRGWCVGRGVPQGIMVWVCVPQGVRMCTAVTRMHCSYTTRHHITRHHTTPHATASHNAVLLPPRYNVGRLVWHTVHA